MPTSEYYTTHANIIRACTYESSPPLLPSNILHTSTQAHISQKSHISTYSQKLTRYTAVTWWFTFESDKRTLARSGLRVVGICAAYDRGMHACGYKRQPSRFATACIIPDPVFNCRRDNSCKACVLMGTVVRLVGAFMLLVNRSEVNKQTVL